VGRGEIKPFDGDLDDYQRYLLDESKRLREEAKANDNATSSPISSAPQAVQVKPVAPVPNRTAAQKKEDALLRQQKSALTKPLKKSIEKADGQLLQLQQEKAALEEKLTQPLAPSEIAEAGKQLKMVNTDLEKLEAQWLAWSEELEQLEKAE
jgi:ATP-binding cassette subfamily F protein 3